jgi:hypothetical protein
VRQCAGGLFWLGHFLCPLLFPPTHPPENPTRAARHWKPARKGQPPTGSPMRADIPKPCPPLYGESGARRLRPRAHCLCGVAPCSGASARRLAAGKEAARRTMRQTQAARLEPRQLGPQFPQLPPLPGRGLRENPRALTPRLAPQKIQHSGILASPLFFCRGVAGLANMPEYWGAGRGVAPAGWGAPLKPRPPFPPSLPRWRGAYGSSCSLGVFLIGSLPSVARARPLRAPPSLGSLRRLAWLLFRLRCAMALRGSPLFLLPLRLLRVGNGGLPRGAVSSPPPPAPCPRTPLPLARLPRALCAAPLRVASRSLPPPPSRWRSIGGNPAASLRSAAYLKTVNHPRPCR